jgi:tRNA threonylcarbamoyladenosine biosynthesis protein TsaE
MELKSILEETLIYADKHNPAIITLRGDLGAGKTYLTDKLAKELGTSALVTSPTFSLMQEYAISWHNKHKIIHFDFYRIANEEAQNTLEQIGFWDYIMPGNIIVIEWPERISPFLRDLETLNINITSGENNLRNYTIYA